MIHQVLFQNFDRCYYQLKKTLLLL